MTPSEEFGQLRLKFTDPVQHHYEVIRPIVLLFLSLSVDRLEVGREAVLNLVKQVRIEVQQRSQ